MGCVPELSYTFYKEKCTYERVYANAWIALRTWERTNRREAGNYFVTSISCLTAGRAFTAASLANAASVSLPRYRAAAQQLLAYCHGGSSVQSLAEITKGSKR